MEKILRTALLTVLVVFMSGSLFATLSPPGADISQAATITSNQRPSATLCVVRCDASCHCCDANFAMTSTSPPTSVLFGAMNANNDFRIDIRSMVHNGIGRPLGIDIFGMATTMAPIVTLLDTKRPSRPQMDINRSSPGAVTLRGSPPAASSEIFGTASLNPRVNIMSSASGFGGNLTPADIVTSTSNGLPAHRLNFGYIAIQNSWRTDVVTPTMNMTDRTLQQTCEDSGGQDVPYVFIGNIPAVKNGLADPPTRLMDATDSSA